jgi:hypothetical protein
MTDESIAKTSTQRKALRWVPTFTLTQLFLVITWIAIGFIAFSRYFTAAPYQGDTHDVEGVTYRSYGLTERTTTRITNDLVSQSPPWHPADPNPPISARGALAIAERFRKARLRNVNNWKWGLESLALLPLNSKERKWCWEVRFIAYPEQGGLGGGAPEFQVFVLMNGEVILPESEAYDYLKDWGILEDEQPKKE